MVKIFLETLHVLAEDNLIKYDMNRIDLLLDLTKLEGEVIPDQKKRINLTPYTLKKRIMSSPSVINLMMNHNLIEQEMKITCSTSDLGTNFGTDDNYIHNPEFEEEINFFSTYCDEVTLNCRRGLYCIIETN